MHFLPGQYRPGRSVLICLRVSAAIKIFWELMIANTLNERKQNREGFLRALNKDFYFKCVIRFINDQQVKYDNAFFSQFCLPFGKADNTPSAVLERVRGNGLQLHPFRLASGAFSTFAQLGFNTI